MIIVVAEKPNMGKDIAKVLGATANRGKYMEGNGYKVTWAYGHLMECQMPQDYLGHKMTTEDLPFFPETFIRQVKPGVRDQYRQIAELFKENDVEYIVNATDADREGQAIFGYIYENTKCRKSVKRLWITSLTESAIREGFANLKDDSEYSNLLESARARQEADWILGMNCSTAIGQGLSIGRVQTPTLRLVVDQFLARKNFRPTPYWQVRLHLSGNDGVVFKGTFADQFQEKEKAEGLLKKVPQFLVVDDKVQSEVRENAPLPFDLTSLQAEANKRYKIKAQKTLDIAQELYDIYKVTTYPRTNSRYLGLDMVDRVKDNIGKLESLNFGDTFRETVSKLSKGFNKTAFKESVGASHHGIIPTFENLNAEFKTADHKKIFELIVNQFVMSLMDPCKKSKLEYRFTCEGYSLKVVGMTILEPGWRALAKKEVKVKDDEDDSQQTLPTNLNKDDLVTVVNKELLEKQKKAPLLLTEATLLKAMESAGKYIEDDVELSKAIKDCGLGTPATRASMIEKLYEKNYMVNEDNYLVPTELGLTLINKVKDLPISSVKLTGDFECKLNKMAEGDYEKSVFDEEIKEFTTEMTMQCLAVRNDIVVGEIGKCPVCGKPIKEGNKSFFCTGWKSDDPNSCKFSVWKEIFGKKINVNTVMQLLKDGKTDVIKGFKSKEGKSFDARLALDANTHGIVLDFNSDTKAVEGLKCPKCGGQIYELEQGFACENYNKEENVGCDYRQAKTICGKKVVTAELLKQLMAGKQSKEIKGFKSKEGKVFDASLVFNAETSRIDFVFKGKETAPFKCPQCGGEVHVYEKGLMCANYKKDDPSSCKFSVFREVSHRLLSVEEIHEIVAFGESKSILGGFVSKDGKKFSCKLRFSSNPETPYRFEMVFPDKK